MNIPVIVDVAIGLIFIYLILSLLASEILELIATVLQWRAQHLRQAIINLLAGDTITDQNIEAAKRLTKDLYNHPLLNDLNQEARGLFATLFRKITWVFSWIYQKLTGGEGVFGNKVTAPSYIPGETFATALIERLGVAKVVEALIDAKFNRFRESIIEEIRIILNYSKNDILKPDDFEKEPSENLKKEPHEDYKCLQHDLFKIYKQFRDRKLTLIAAIDNISLRIDRFIQTQDDKQKQDKLKLWKRGLFGKQNELAIVNGGLKPTLEEVADLVNLSSRTYQSFKEEFETYFEKRQEQAAEELLNFLLVFDLSIRIIRDSNTSLDSFYNEISSIKERYSEFWVPDPTPPVPDSTPLKIGSSFLKIDTTLNGKVDDLKAFKEGFGEQGHELLGSRLKLKWKKKLGFLVIFLIVALLPAFLFGRFAITPIGGALFVMAPVVVFILFIMFGNIKSDSGKLSNLIDDFFNIEESLSEKSKDTRINEFRQYFADQINSLNNNKDKSLLQWELSRLGQSFRQYYRALALNNADVDLPFVPSSVKQSVASLVRRAKTKIARTGNEVDQLREEVEIWFDRSMDRSSGVYKRNAKGITILIGFLLAVVTNSDSIYIVNRLASDQELRQAVVQGAQKFVEESKSSTSENELRDRSQIVSQLLNEQLALPIGWNPRVLGRQLDCELPEDARDELPENARDDWDKLFDKCISPERNTMNGTIKDRVLEKPKVYFIPTAILAMIFTLGKWQLGLLFLIGWFVTAIAISMGATFWFELLGKLVNVRNTGNRPPSSANQTSVNSEKSS